MGSERTLSRSQPFHELGVFASTQESNLPGIRSSRQLLDGDRVGSEDRIQSHIFEDAPLPHTIS